MATPILILGAGMVGTCTALHLQQRGFDVTLIDRRPPGQETSFGNAGLIQGESVEPYPFPRDPGFLLDVALGRGAEVHWHLRGLWQMAGPLLRYFRNSHPQAHAVATQHYSRLIAHAIAEHAPLIAAAGAEDLVVREALDRSLPAAGVGCAFSRRALERIAADHDHAIFNTASLTEDYDLGLRLKAYGLRQAFVKYFVHREVMDRHPLTGRRRIRRVRELVCVKEFFPGTFRTAVRQKSRWVLGISLQGWQQIGWSGSGWRRYMLWRDRKALFTNPVNVLGYAVVPLVGAALLAGVPAVPARSV